MIRPTLKEIRQSAIILYGTNNFDKKSRERAIVKQRQVIHYVCVRGFEHSLKTTGMEFGLVDHATVLHSCTVIGNELSQFTNIRDDVRELINLCRNNNTKGSPESIIINILSDTNINEYTRIQLRQVLDMLNDKK